MSRFAVPKFWISNLFFDQWNRRDLTTLAAAVSFQFILSTAPMLILLGLIAPFLPHDLFVQARVVIANLVHPDVLQFLDFLAEELERVQTSTFYIQGVIAAVIALISATSFFVQIHLSFAHLWHRKPEEFLSILRQRLIAFLMLIALFSFLVASIVVNSVIGFVENWIPIQLPLSSYLIPSILFTLLLMNLYRWIPPQRPRWRSVLIATAFTVPVVEICDRILKSLLSKFWTVKAFGAAGFFAGAMLWVYLISYLVLLGALLVYSIETSSADLAPADEASKHIQK